MIIAVTADYSLLSRNYYQYTARRCAAVLVSQSLILRSAGGILAPRGKLPSGFSVEDKGVAAANAPVCVGIGIGTGSSLMRSSPSPGPSRSTPPCVFRACKCACSSRTTGRATGTGSRKAAPSTAAANFDDHSSL